MYVCLFVCMYVCLCVCVYVCIYIYNEMTPLYFSKKHGVLVIYDDLQWKQQDPHENYWATNTTWDDEAQFRTYFSGGGSTTNHQPPTSSWLYPHYTSISIFVGFPFFNSSSSGDANHGGWGRRCVEGPDQWANPAELTSSLETKMGWTSNSAVNHLPFGVLKYGWEGNSL